MTGQSLIRAAELRSVTSDLSRYESAVYTFRDKYFALPGDMTNATQFWGIAGTSTTGNDATCFNATSNGTTTCNGNGNKLIFSSNGAEQYHAWVHLKNAGLVEGSFTGRRVNDPRQAVPGVNVPRSKLKNGGFTLYSISWGDGDSLWYSGSYNPAITAGTQTNTVQAYNPLFKAEEAFDIDSKIDDGRPGLGRVRTFHSNSNCVSSTDEADQNIAAYNLTANTIACALIYSFDNPGQ